MTRDVDVSVVVPCYNTERYLDQALTSAEQNATCALEILVINDGSTDGSLSIMRAHEVRDHRVRVIDKPNQGYGATVNRGIDEARGTYVAILEPDDWVCVGAYDRMWELAQRTAMPDVVKAAYWRIMTRGGAANNAGDVAAHGQGVQKAYGYLRGRVPGAGKRMRLADAPQLIQYHPSVWSCLYTREFLVREGIRFVEAPGAGWVDNPFSVRALAAAKSIVYTDEAFYCYREDLAEASSAHVDPHLMVERWHQRQDALDELGADDEGVLRANCVVGLQWLARILAGPQAEDGEVLEELRGMCRRMDSALVASVDCVSPHVVWRALELMGSDREAPSQVGYARYLAREAAWAIRNNGFGFFAHNLALARGRRAGA